MTDTQQRIDELVKSNEVVLFMKGNASFPQCGFSGRAIQILKACGVDSKALVTVNVLEDAEIRAGIKDYSQWPTIPQLYVKGEFIGGSDIMMEMYQNGELQQVIGAWSDEADLQTKCHNLRTQLDLSAVLLTRSEEGMTLFDAQGQCHVSAQAREVFDVTGAGDTVIATMAAFVAAGMSLRDALPLANRAGGLVVGKFGTATVSFEELFA